jgi:hypothetical protein
MSRTAPLAFGHSGTAMLRLLAVLGFALALGACTKCDIPTWQHSSTGNAPVACHDSPGPQ